MKKVKRVILLILVIALSASACANVAHTTSEPTTTPPEPQSRRELSWSEDPWDEFDVVLDKIGTPQGSKTELDIPVYYENELLFNTNGMFYLNRDACMYKNLNSRPNSASAILAAYPTDALRVRADGSSYAIYDTDTGYRFYLFFESEAPVTAGFPIVIKEMLCYSDFKNINIGDSISDVERIDEVTGLYMQRILKTDPVSAASLAEYGHPCTTIHYLKDGILKIEYTMPSEGVLIVSNIIFDKDFNIKSADGTIVSHKIDDIDLPA